MFDVALWHDDNILRNCSGGGHHFFHPLNAALSNDLLWFEIPLLREVTFLKHAGMNSPDVNKNPCAFSGF